MITWWACNAFVPLLGSTLATEHAAQLGCPPTRHVLAEAWKSRASNDFNFGGLAGSIAAIALGRMMGPATDAGLVFLFSAVMLFVTFGLDLAASTRLVMLFLVGAGVYGVFGTFTFYLPELFPTRLARHRSGFCLRVPNHRRRSRPRRAGAGHGRGVGDGSMIGGEPLHQGQQMIAGRTRVRVHEHYVRLVAAEGPDIRRAREALPTTGDVANVGTWSASSAIPSLLPELSTTNR